MGRSRRAWRARFIVAGGLVLGLMPGPVRAESTLWTLTASPLAVTTGAATTFRLTATNEDPLAALLSSSEIGCLWVDVPSNFSVAAASVTNSTTGSSWTVSRAGNRVRVYTTSGGDRLKLLDSVTFTIGATATSTGSLAWNAKAYRRQDCMGTGALLGVPPVVVVSGAAATPTPTPTPTPRPTPTPTPRPTATPTPTPTPIIVLPTLPLPSLTVPTATPQPTATPRASSGASSQPSASTSPAPGSQEPGATPPASAEGSATPAPSDGVAPDGSTATPPAAEPGAVGGDPGVPGGAIGAPRVAFDRTNVNLGIGPIDFLDGAEVWAVPAATIGVPGLLLLLWVGLQAIGTLAWIPAVRRLRGEEPPGA